MISNEVVMQDIGMKVKRNADLDALFKQRANDGLATFRGGQFAGTIVVAQLGEFLESFMSEMRHKLCPLLWQWSMAGKSKIKCISIIRQILTLAAASRIPGFGD